MIYKTEAEVALMKEAALLVSKALAEVAGFIKQGVTTLQIDKLCETVVKDHGAVPSFFNYRGYPFNICASVNDVVVHGFPNETPIKNGDIVSIDLGVILNGWHGDHAYSFIVGEVAPEVLNLVKVTKESLYKGIEKAIVNNRVGDIGFAVQSHCEGHGYSVVTELVGHGVGRELHEDPQIPNYGRRGAGKKLQEGLVIAIEPMINLGKKELGVAEDGWTYITKDGKASAHYEHTIALTKSGPLILSDFSIVEQAELSNKNLNTSYFA